MELLCQAAILLTFWNAFSALAGMLHSCTHSSCPVLVQAVGQAAPGLTGGLVY